MRLPFLVLSFLLVSSSLFGWRWPVEVPVVTGTFGQAMGGGILRGIQLGGGAQPVYPVAEGTVVLVGGGAEGESPLGSYIVVQHDQGFLSVYAHLEPGSIGISGGSVGPDTQIGIVGHSGPFAEPTLTLYILDQETNSHVNPLLILPDPDDSVPPEVVSIFAVGDTGQYDLQQVSEVPVGSYDLMVRIEDRAVRRAGAPRFAPYSVDLYVDGQERYSVAMDSMTVDEASLRIRPSSGATEIYDRDGLFRLGQLTAEDGPTRIEIVARDFVGNETVLEREIRGVKPQ